MSITNAINSAVVTGTSYQPQAPSGGPLESSGVNTASSLLAAGSSAPSDVSGNILSAAYQQPLTPTEQVALQNSVDDMPLQSIIQATQANTSTALLQTANGTDLYASTQSLLEAQYLGANGTDV